MSFLASPTSLLTAEAAQQKIESIQAALLRVQRACEYRDEHPYDPVEAQGGGDSSGSGVGVPCPTDGGQRGGSTPRTARPASADPFIKAPNSSAIPEVHSAAPADHREEKATAGTRLVLSFSQFERRRIAQLLGRVAVDIAAVWAYVHQWSSLGEVTADAASESGICTSGKGHLNGGRTRSASQPTNGNDGNLRWASAVKGNPEAHMAALNTLIHTAVSIQQMLAGGDDRRGTGAGKDSVVTVFQEGSVSPNIDAAQGDASFATTARPDSAVPSASATQQEDSSAPSPSPPPSAELAHTLPAPSNMAPPPAPSPAPPPPEQPAGLRSTLAAQPSATSSSIHAAHGDNSAATAAVMASIPAYLKAYVWEGSGKTTPEGEGEEDEEDDDDATVVVVNAERGDSRSISGGSTTGVNPRSFSRVSDTFAASHTGSRNTSPFPMDTSPGTHVHNSPGSSNTRVQGNASSIIAHHRFDSDMTFTATSSPFKRVVSISSSLIGSPVLAQPYSQPRSQGNSGMSALSQPAPNTTSSQQNNSFSNNNNYNSSSTSARSPDSAEMSPAAVAAYSRSTSLLRRPHKLEVPVSRTQSLRRTPSYTSPTSMTSGSSPPDAAAVTNNTRTALYSDAPVPSLHVAKAHSGGGSGGGCVPVVGAPALSSSSPVGPPTNATGDSPPSSLAGLHFKRVISVDSEAGGWPPGSLVDSLEMSPSKGTSLFGRLAAASYSTNLTPSPAPQEMPAENEGQRATVVGAPMELTVPTAYLSHSSGGSGGGGMDVGGASTASSALTTSYLVPGNADSIRNGSLHSRNLTPYSFPSPGGGAPPRVSAPAPPPPPPPPAASPRPVVLQSSTGKTPTTGPSPSARPTAVNSVSAAAAPSTTSFMQGQAVRANTLAGGRANVIDSAPLPPHSYKINAEKLATFLQCVRGLVQMEFSEEEFDSMHLFYFLPGVSLAKPAAAPEEGNEGPEGRTGSTATATSKAGNEEAPLPLFNGGERVPVRRTKLDVFYSLVKRKVQEICDNVGVPSASYLSLL
ncbi:hypothetical protein ABB37_04684 [Leptomonas pyrrhocoris]|uniref:Uncharacterized protein n=1 Tax=Leptomonas pyrrhocoris TaxID=157538 RepID=A0A0N0VFE2_LEPPY|nr:hypothetical protein ABB37_04684 [Leptomonas pyrrhocoris]KPA80458.1 hypothetical protein ABB37_04684 [Leptomonas pyrrhocoris]|eukprot:XP_015658897.1 hypothetical protein ABB37_04684 [Leptomonas pyrrhocoris]